jgi:hypothetical protein
MQLFAPGKNACPGKTEKLTKKQQIVNEQPRWIAEQALEKEYRQTVKRKRIEYETDMGEQLPWNKRMYWQEVGSILLNQSWPASGKIMAPDKCHGHHRSPVIQAGDSYTPGKSGTAGQFNVTCLGQPASS